MDTMCVDTTTVRSATAVADARQTARVFLEALRQSAIDPETADSVVLVVSELVTNALRHGGGTFTLHHLAANPDTVEVAFAVFDDTGGRGAAGGCGGDAGMAGGAKLPSVPRKSIVPLSVEQVRALSEQVPGRYKALVLLGRPRDYGPVNSSGSNSATWTCCTRPSRSSSRSSRRQGTGCTSARPRPRARTARCRCPGLAFTAPEGAGPSSTPTCGPTPRSALGPPSTRRTRTAPPRVTRRPPRRRNRSPALTTRQRACGPGADR